MNLIQELLNKFIINKIPVNSLHTILNPYLKNINDIVDSVILNNKIETNNHVLYNKEDEYIDETRDLKNFCTDIVSNYILDENELYNFLYIINLFYKDSINYYIKKQELHDNSIIFLFKGGNIFKLIASKFWSELPNQAMYKLIDEYQHCFKRSDLDFGIYIDPDIENVSKIIEDITLISYKIQLVIVDIFFSHKELCFKWFRYSKSHQNHILKKLLQDLNIMKNNKFKNILFYNNSVNNSQYKYKNQTNKYLDFEDDSVVDKRDNIIMSDITYNSDNFMYTSINKALRFSTNKRVLKFNLTRTKINFDLELDNNIMSIGGELIDVSIGKDEASVKFYKNKNIYLNNILFVNNNLGYFLNNVNEFNMNIYSYQYLYKDLKFILFETVYLPWSDKKYIKRLNRTFYITFIDFFKNSKVTKKSIHILYQYFDLLTNSIQDINYNYIHNLEKKKDIEKLSTLLVKSKQKEVFEEIKCNKSSCLLIDLLKSIILVIERVLYPRELINKSIYNNIFTNNKINNNRILDNNEMNELIIILKTVKKNINNLKIVFSYIQNYSKSDFEFDYKTINSKLLL